MHEVLVLDDAALLTMAIGEYPCAFVEVLDSVWFNDADTITHVTLKVCFTIEHSINGR